MCVSPVCIVLGGVTPGGILIYSTCNLSSYCRRQAAVSCVTLFSCLKYGLHKYRIHVSLYMLGMLSLYFHTI